jgi:Glycosyl transferase family 2
MPRVAAVTMTYNEPDFVPIWTRHYGRHVGPEHCYVFDHGSDDGSTDGLGDVNVIHLPRSPFDEPSRRRFINAFCGSLLEYYDFVLHADIDEIVLPDPRRHATLTDYCSTPRGVATNAIGLNVQHVPALEPALALTRPVTLQRRFVWLGSTMCKPLLIRGPVTWSQGGHCCEYPVTFDGLYMFHLRWFDLALGLKRLAKTRAMPWSDEPTGATYQKMDDAAFTALFNGLASRPRRGHVQFDPARGAIMADMLRKVAGSWVPETHEAHRISLTIASQDLWPIPRYFQGAF